MSAQVTDTELRSMTAEEIVQAQTDGRLRTLLGSPPAPPAAGPLTADHLAAMSAEEIVQAQNSGQLDGLLGRTPTAPQAA